MKRITILIITVLYLFSCEPDYWAGDSEYDYMSPNGWKNENIKIETSWIQLDGKYTKDMNTQYFKWYRNDTLIMEGYIKDFIDNYAKRHETYALVLLSNGFYTQFKKVVLENDQYNQTVLDTKWPRKTKDSLSMFDYERLEWY